MYSPKIKQELIPKLYRIGKECKKPMTVIVDEFLKVAIDEYERNRKDSTKVMKSDSTVHSE